MSTSSIPAQCRQVRLVLESLGVSNLESIVTQARSCCNWNSTVTIECDSRDKVTILKAQNSRLIGTIPSVVGELTELQVLNLADNQLSGTIPREIASLTNLRELHLMNNSLSGSIDLPWGKLGNLHILHLYNNKLEGTIPKELAAAVNLRHLELSGNKLVGPIPEELAGLQFLEVLWLHNNRLSGSIPVLPSVKTDNCNLRSKDAGEANQFDCISPNITFPQSNVCLRPDKLKTLPTCTTAPSPPKSEPAAAAPTGSGFPMGAVIGIAAGILVLVIAAVLLMMRRRRRHQSNPSDGPPSLEGAVHAKPMARRPVADSPLSSGQSAISTPSLADRNSVRMSFVVDSHGNRHSIHYPAQALTAVDGTQFVMVQPASTAPPVPVYPQMDGTRDVRLMRQSVVSNHSDVSSLVSAANASQHPVYASHLGRSASAAAQAQSVPIPPIPHLYPNEVVYLGNDPRASISTTATMATDLAESSKETTAMRAARDATAFGQVTGDAGVVKQAVAERPMSLVTVNVPDGYTVSLVPVSRPQTPAVGESQSVGGNGRM